MRRLHPRRPRITSFFHILGERFTVIAIGFTNLLLALPRIMRQHPTRTNVINMVVLDFEVVNWGGAGTGEFLLDPDRVAGEVLESLAHAEVHGGDVVVAVLGPDRMIASDLLLPHAAGARLQDERS